MMSASRVFCSTLSICKYLFHFYISIFVNVHVFFGYHEDARFVCVDGHLLTVDVGCGILSGHFVIRFLEIE